MKKAIILVTIILTFIVYQLMGFHGVIGLWIIPAGFTIGGLMLFTMWKLLKYLFLGGIVIASVVVLFICFGAILSHM